MLALDWCGSLLTPPAPAHQLATLLSVLEDTAKELGADLADARLSAYSCMLSSIFMTPPPSINYNSHRRFAAAAR